MDGPISVGTDSIRIRVTPAERFELKRLAQAAGKTIPLYVLHAALGAPEQAMEFEDIGTVITEAGDTLPPAEMLEGLGEKFDGEE